MRARVPVAPGASVRRVALDGSTTVLAPVSGGGAVEVALGQDPVIVVVR